VANFIFLLNESNVNTKIFSIVNRKQILKLILDGNFEEDRVTEVEYLLKGIPLNLNEQVQINQSFVEDIIIVILLDRFFGEKLAFFFF